MHTATSGLELMRTLDLLASTLGRRTSIAMQLHALAIRYVHRYLLFMLVESMSEASRSLQRIRKMGWRLGPVQRGGGLTSTLFGIFGSIGKLQLD